MQEVDLRGTYARDANDTRQTVHSRLHPFHDADALRVHGFRLRDRDDHRLPVAVAAGGGRDEDMADAVDLFDHRCGTRRLISADQDFHRGERPSRDAALL